MKELELRENRGAGTLFTFLAEDWRNQGNVWGRKRVRATAWKKRTKIERKRRRTMLKIEPGSCREGAHRAELKDEGAHSRGNNSQRVVTTGRRPDRWSRWLLYAFVCTAHALLAERSLLKFNQGLGKALKFITEQGGFRGWNMGVQYFVELSQG